MIKISKLRVLVSGLRGVGAESAKNLILTGVNSVVLHDDNIVSLTDLGSNFCLNEQDIGIKTRADASLNKLQEISYGVKVSVHKGELLPSFLLSFDVIVLTETNLAKINSISSIIHESPSPPGLVICESWGVCGHIFVDFGPNFQTFESSDSRCETLLISTISQSNPGRVVLHDYSTHNLADGDCIKFEDIEGMTELNSIPSIPIKRVSPHVFTICDTSNFSEYSHGGLARQVKVKSEFTFKPYQESLETDYNEEDFKYIADFGKYDRNLQLHLACWAVREFQDRNQRLPQLFSEVDAGEVIRIANEINESRQFKVKIVQEDVLKMVSLYARAQIAPMATFWGGMVAQEVLKFIGKYTPIKQFMYFDWFEIVEDSEDRTLENTRYDDQISIIGKKAHSSLSSCKSLLVGAGSLGNEFLKLYALMGLSTQNGEILLSDESIIKPRHLTSHSLFRLSDIGSKKSLQASSSALTLNPSLNLSPTPFNITPETDSLQTDDFWESQDFIISSVRSCKSKSFIDDKSILYELPAFFASSRGVQGMSHLNLPYLSQSYSESPVELESNHSLKLQSFPYLPDHCLLWAEYKFMEIFGNIPKEFNIFIGNPKDFISSSPYSKNFSYSKERLEKIETFLNICKFEDCVKVLIEVFNELFSVNIRNLLINFPPDYKNKYGEWLWTGEKRRPNVLRFDLDDSVHLGFVYAGANVLASVFGFHQVRDLQVFKTIAASVLEFNEEKWRLERLEGFRVNQESSEEEEKKIMMNIFNRVCEVYAKGQKLKIKEVVKDADDDDNLHVEFLCCAARLRARNFRIPEVDWISTKIYSAMIKPEVVMSNSILAGTVAMEVYKLFLKRGSKDFRSFRFNSSWNNYTLFDPIEPKKNKSVDFDPIIMGPVKAYPEGFTVWTKINIKGPLTLNQFIQKFNEDHRLKINGIYCQNKAIYLFYSKISDLNLMDKQVHEIYEEKIGKKIVSSRKFLPLVIWCVSEPDEIDHNIPLVKYNFKPY